jgi:SRSO17 transposase
MRPCFFMSNPFLVNGRHEFWLVLQFPLGRIRAVPSGGGLKAPMETEEIDEVTRAEQCARRVDGMVERLAPRFRRRAAHRHAADYLRGLVADVERKNGWQLAERAGYRHPRGIQRVLDRYAWDADAVRDDLRTYVVAELGDPQGILVVDETGFLKQGTRSVGVARQYSGTAGKVENCQIGVFLGYASPKGRAGLDRELFLPRAWAEDPVRRAAAGVPEGTPHRTKPEIAREMVLRALAAGVTAAWVVADEVYGASGSFRRALEDQAQPYVVAVRANEMPTTWPPYAPPGQITVGAIALRLPEPAWQRLSCGEGAQGPRVYDWAWVPVRPALADGWVHGVLLRRALPRPEEVAFYLTYARAGTPLAAMAAAAGARWAIEDTFKLAKGQVGLDHYEVRSWQGWYRHVTLALLALAALAAGAQKGETTSGRAPSRSASPSSAICSSAWSGRPPIPPITSWPGRAGGASTRTAPATAIGNVAWNA